MWRIVPRAALAAGLAAGVLAACSSSREPDPVRLDALRDADRPVFWVGERFRGLSLTRVTRSSVGYGRCRAASDAGCALPLSIQTVPACPSSIPVVPLRGRTTRRGVPAGRRGGAVVLLADGYEVRVFGDRGRALAAVAAMRTTATGRPFSVAAGEPLPAPPPGAERRGPC